VIAARPRLQERNIVRPLTFGYLTLAECAQPDIVDAAAAAGFRSLGLRVEERRAGEPYAHRVVGDAARLRAIRDRLAATGLRLSNVCGRYLVPETAPDDLRALVDTGAELGCSNILANGYDPDPVRTRDNLARLCEFARAAGIGIAIEFVPYQRIRNLDEAYALVKSIGADNLGLVPDPLHLDRSGGSPAQLADVPRDRIFYAQICDAPRGRPATLDGCLAEARTGRLYPGEGGLPLREYVAALPAECEIEIEVANAADKALPPAQRARKVADALARFLDVAIGTA
jgi:sugar phosphate isomerase/epimerase